MSARAELRYCAVLGSPISHSLSPLLHRTAYAALGMDHWRYDAIETTAAELPDRIAALGPQWRGLSLTMPLKEAAFEVASEVSQRAAAAGSINTLVRRADGNWRADNTDIAGIIGALGGGSLAESATIVGAGATARSACLALTSMGARQITVVARSPDKASAWLEQVMRPDQVGRVVTLDTWHPSAEPIVSTVPPSAARAVADRLAGCELAGQPLLDVVYANWPTPLARAATVAGARVVSGVDMLVHQAVAQFEQFTGRTAPLAELLLAARVRVGLNRE